jgi:hypothetical protein
MEKAAYECPEKLISEFDIYLPLSEVPSSVSSSVKRGRPKKFVKPRTKKRGRPSKGSHFVKI